MAPPAQVIQWLETNYPKPRVDPEWLSQCYDYLIESQNHNPTTNLPALLESLEYQLLRSDLRESMLPGTGLPTHASHPETTLILKGPPILVEIISLTEIAHSAFSLNQIRKVRDERMQAGTADNDEEGEADLEVEGEGPMPKYPRGLLKLELSDGMTTLPAVERWPLLQLSLEDTSMGYKMLLKNVSIRRGIAHLGPDFVVLKGHETAMREKRRPFDFTRGLYRRMGLPPPPQPVDDEDDAEHVPADESAGRAPLNTNPAVNSRSPLRDISPPSMPPPNIMNDDTDLEPRRRRIPSHNPNPLTVPAPTPMTIASSISSTLAPASSKCAPTKPIASPYFSTVSFPSGSGSGSTSITARRSPTHQPPHSMGLNLTPVHRSTNNDSLLPPPSRPPPSATQRTAMSGEERFRLDFGPSAGMFLDGRRREREANFNARANVVQGGLHTRAVAAVLRKGKAREAAPEKDSTESDEFEDDGMEIDVDFLEGLDRAEREALETQGHLSLLYPDAGGSGSTVTIGSSAIGGSAPAVVSRVAVTEVITIDDDEDGEGDDKENRPVPTRHIRRRTEDGGSGGLGMGTQGTNGGRPVMLGNVIELSDSD